MGKEHYTRITEEFYRDYDLRIEVGTFIGDYLYKMSRLCESILEEVSKKEFEKPSMELQGKIKTLFDMFSDSVSAVLKYSILVDTAHNYQCKKWCMGLNKEKDNIFNLYNEKVFENWEEGFVETYLIGNIQIIRKFIENNLCELPATLYLFRRGCVTEHRLYDETNSYDIGVTASEFEMLTKLMDKPSYFPCYLSSEDMDEIIAGARLYNKSLARA